MSPNRYNVASKIKKFIHFLTHFLSISRMPIKYQALGIEKWILDRGVSIYNTMQYGW